MNMWTRRGAFLTEEEGQRRQRAFNSSRLKTQKSRSAIHASLGSYKTRDSSINMAQRLITSKELDFYLYGRTDVLPVKLEEGSPEEQRMKQQSVAHKIPYYEEKSVDILQLRYKQGVEKEFRSTEEFNKVLEAITSIPPKLHLCYSSIPGAGFGICATDVIASGTWIGPYEGKRVSIKEIESMLDTRYVWEIYKNGALDHGINGVDQEESTWMKYIQCARNKDEQNTVAFQFGADIYFQTYKPIAPGDEVLVWYAEYYEQYHGIPVGVRKLAKNEENSQTVTRTTEALEMTQRRSEIPPKTQNVRKPRPIKQRDLPPPLASPLPPLNSNLVNNVNRAFSPEPTEEGTPRSLVQIPKLPALSHFSPQNPISEPSDSNTIALRDTLVVTEDTSPIQHAFKTRFWKCNHCLSKFPQKWALQVHKCPCEVTKPYKCSSCDKPFASKDDVQKHAARCGGGKQYKCSYCGRSFLNVNILSKHIKVHSRQTVANGQIRKKVSRVPIYQRLVQ